jgi:hypothetical protein
MYRSKKRAPRSKKHASRKRGREKHWETYYPKSKFGKYFDPCNSMMNDKFPVATWDIWKHKSIQNGINEKRKKTAGLLLAPELSLNMVKPF